MLEPLTVFDSFSTNDEAQKLNNLKFIFSKTTIKLL